MRSTTRRVVAVLCAAAVVLGACGGDDGGGAAGDRSDDASDGAPTSSEAPDTGDATTIAAATVATTAAPTTAATTAPPTTAAATTAPPTTPAPTAPPTTAKPAPTTTAAAITFVQFSVNLAGACAAPDVSVPVEGPTVEMAWKLAGVIPDDVYVAVDNADGPYETGLPTQGTYDLGFPCDGNKHTYYVVAVLGTQKFVKSKKVG